MLFGTKFVFIPTMAIRVIIAWVESRDRLENRHGVFLIPPNRWQTNKEQF